MEEAAEEEEGERKARKGSGTEQEPMKDDEDVAGDLEIQQWRCV